jgi:D-alanyl-D-alanine carboxypeptidase (penicillin-binding protein 5/6)
LEKDLYVAIPRGQYDLLKANMDVDTDIVAPIDQGQQVGAVKITLKGEAYLDKPLVALQANPKGGLWRRIVDFFVRLFS